MCRFISDVIICTETSSIEVVDPLQSSRAARQVEFCEIRAFHRGSYVPEQIVFRQLWFGRGTGFGLTLVFMTSPVPPTEFRDSVAK